MSIDNERDEKGIREAARVAATLRNLLATQCLPGVSTQYLEHLCRVELKALGAQSAPQRDYGAPSAAFYSVNQDVVHGLPSTRTLKEGDLVKIDVTPVYDGYVADTALSLVVGGPGRHPAADRLIESAREAMNRALSVCRPGTRINQIGRAVENWIRQCGYFVIEELAGHGVGRAVHEEPSVPNYYDPRQTDRLTEGLVIAIEPMIATRRTLVRIKPDGWTLAAASGTLTAHWEHTVLITDQGPVVLTA